jgi:hippurate hydrolase
MINDAELARRLKTAWTDAMGQDRVVDIPPTGMGGEDFPFFTLNPDIPSVFWRIGGTAQAALDRAKSGGEAVASHHSPLFKVEPEPSIRASVESTVVALLELMPD